MNKKTTFFLIFFFIVNCSLDTKSGLWTKSEILSKEHGIDNVHFGLVMPVPGTPIFNYCIENNLLPVDYNPDKFQWTKANLVNTPVPPHKLESIRDKAWEEFNNEEFKKSRKNWAVRSPINL